MDAYIMRYVKPCQKTDKFSLINLSETIFF